MTTDRGSLATRKMVYRILDQYKNSPNFVGLIEAIGKRFDDTDAIIEHLLFGRFLETAENFELDNIGKLLMTPRPYEVDPNTVFTYRSVSDPNDINKGFGTVSDPSIGGAYNSVNGLTTDTFVDDETYRQILRGRAKVLSIGPSIPEFYTWITETFDLEVTLSIPSVMRLEVEITSGQVTQRIRNLIENEGPTLPGVSVLITNWSA